LCARSCEQAAPRLSFPSARALTHAPLAAANCSRRSRSPPPPTSRRSVSPQRAAASAPTRRSSRRSARPGASRSSSWPLPSGSTLVSCALSLLSLALPLPLSPSLAQGAPLPRRLRALRSAEQVVAGARMRRARMARQRVKARAAARARTRARVRRLLRREAAAATALRASARDVGDEATPTAKLRPPWLMSPAAMRTALRR
jgi:hypothetical protein